MPSLVLGIDQFNWIMYCSLLAVMVHSLWRKGLESSGLAWRGSMGRKKTLKSRQPCLIDQFRPQNPPALNLTLFFTSLSLSTSLRAFLVNPWRSCVPLGLITLRYPSSAFVKAPTARRLPTLDQSLSTLTWFFYSTLNEFEILDYFAKDGSDSVLSLVITGN